MRKDLIERNINKMKYRKKPVIVEAVQYLLCENKNGTKIIILLNLQNTIKTKTKKKHMVSSIWNDLLER